MATKVNHRTCQRCRQPVKPRADHIRGIHWASNGTLIWHWNCFATLLKENSEVTVRELVRATREIEVGEPRDGLVRTC